MNPPGSFSALISLIIQLISYIIAALITAIFLVTIWKVIDAWIINAGDEQKRTAGRQTLVSAVIVLLVLISIWGIIAVLSNTLFGMG